MRTVAEKRVTERVCPRVRPRPVAKATVKKRVCERVRMRTVAEKRVTERVCPRVPPQTVAIPAPRIDKRVRQGVGIRLPCSSPRLLSAFGSRSSCFPPSAFRLGLRLSVFGFRPSDFGFRSSAVGLRPSDFGFRSSAVGLRPSDFGFRFSAFGFRFSAFGFRSSAFGIRPSARLLMLMSSWPRIGFRLSVFVFGLRPLNPNPLQTLRIMSQYFSPKVTLSELDDAMHSVGTSFSQ